MHDGQSFAVLALTVRRGPKKVRGPGRAVVDFWFFLQENVVRVGVKSALRHLRLGWILPSTICVLGPWSLH